MLDLMKDLGFKYSSKAGITVGVSDIVVLPDKQQIIDETEEKVEKVYRGFNTEDERLWRRHRTLDKSQGCHPGAPDGITPPPESNLHDE